MNEIDAALERLEKAVGALGEALESIEGDEGANGSALASERDALAEEVAALKAAQERDAELRAEAAEAVKAALSDLRTLMPARVGEEAAHG